jgi:hypothetical protein
MSRDFAKLACAAILCAGLASPAPAAAGEADDLQAMIDRARQGTQDLERLDERGTSREDVTLLRTWLDEAWRFRSEQEFDKVRVVLTRCDAQAEMIRQKIAASKVSAQAAEKEAGLKRLRDDIDKTKKAIHQAALQKAGLEARTK